MSIIRLENNPTLRASFVSNKCSEIYSTINQLMNDIMFEITQDDMQANFDSFGHEAYKLFTLMNKLVESMKIVNADFVPRPVLHNYKINEDGTVTVL